MPQILTHDRSTSVQTMAWQNITWVNVDPKLCCHLVYMAKMKQFILWLNSRIYIHIEYLIVQRAILLVFVVFGTKSRNVVWLLHQELLQHSDRFFKLNNKCNNYIVRWHFLTGVISHSGPTEVEDCSLPPPNMAATKTGEQGKAWFSVL